MSTPDTPARKAIPRLAGNDYDAGIIKERQDFVARETGVTLNHVAHTSWEDASVLAGNVENALGVAQVPIGLAGPLVVNGEHAQGEFYVPLATTEGTLVASYNRGMRLVAECGGIKATVVERYRDTVLGRQELDGELIEDRPDALWQRGMFRASDGAVDGRIVVAVDPPVTGTERSDACGIIVAGRLGEGAVVLEDATLQGVRPDIWAARAVAAYRAHEADCIVAEVNQGGDLVGQILNQVDASVPVRKVRANRGKWVRAEPVAAVYARGLVRHVAGLTALEDELCAFGPDGKAEGHSPDRVDALVWALTDLMLNDVRPRVRGL